MDDFRKLLEQKILEGAFELKPSQDKISLPTAFRIYKKMKASLKFDAIKISDDIVIEGHHRYVASVLAEKSIERFLSTKNHTQTVFDWKDVILKTVDYDDQSVVRYHNFNDALRNGISLKQVEKLLQD
jgi:hypothetical protein